MGFKELFAAPIRNVSPADEPDYWTLLFASDDLHYVSEKIAIESAACRNDDRVALTDFQFMSKSRMRGIRFIVCIDPQKTPEM